MNKTLIKNQTIQTNTILRGLKITEEEQMEYDKMIDLEIDDIREEKLRDKAEEDTEEPLDEDDPGINMIGDPKI